MSVTAHIEQAPPAPQEARCRSCGGWLASAPAGAAWVRARCGNKRCRLYGDGQMIRFREQDLPPNH